MSPRPYFLNHVAGRVIGRVLGLKREPRRLTEADYRMLDIGFAFVAGLAAMGLTAAVLILFCARPTC